MKSKKVLALCFLMLVILLLAACGNNQEQNNVQVENADQSEQSNQGGQNSEESTQTTRTIAHLKGETEVPMNIERAVVLSASYIDHMLTIGEKPYGVNVEIRYGGDYPLYLADQLEGVHLVGSADEPNLEAIVELDPDVIIIESRTAETNYAQLEKIAPTIVLGTEWLEYEDDTTYWTKDLLKIAELYGKEDVAREKIAELEEKTVEAKQKIETLGSNKKLAYLRIREKGIQIYAKSGHPMNTLLYHDLGFSPTALTPEEQRQDLSLEVLPDVDADYIMLEVDANGHDNLKSIQESSLWSPVPAVQNNQVFETDSFWLFKGWGVIGRGQIIDDILKLLELEG